MEIAAKKTQHGNRDYVRVARTLRDKLDGLITAGDTDLGTQRKMLLDVSQELDLALADKATHRHDEISICTHSCCEHEQVLNPALWSTLPTELLQRLLAKLPIPNICRLKSLSKEWKLSLESSSSEFTVALKESSPRMLARVKLGRGFKFSLHVLDGRNNRWHQLDVIPGRSLSSPSRTFVHMNGAADAGLVCFVCKDFITGLNNIHVINPMTGAVNNLPNLNSLTNSELTMMRIVVDRNTYHYKVIVVKHGPPVEAEVYDSEVQQWTKPKPSLGRIFGIAHYWSRDEYSNWSARKRGPCAYDCRDGKYYDFRQDREKWFEKKVISYTLTKDRLFILYREAESAFISSYCVPENATSWVKEETHICFPRVLGPIETEMTGRIHACCGFLVVLLRKQQGGWLLDADSQKYIWVYDLATCEWRALPWWAEADSHKYIWVYDLAICEWRAIPWWAESFLTDVVCEVHWNIRP